MDLRVLILSWKFLFVADHVGKILKGLKTFFRGCWGIPKKKLDTSQFQSCQERGDKSDCS